VQPLVDSADRIRFIDLARGLAVAFMVAVHVLEEMSAAAVQDSAFGQVVEFLGGPPAAPVFMFLLGVSFLMSRRNGVRASVSRGLRLLLLGYVLNFVRGTLPALVGLATGTFEIGEIEPWTPSALFWTVDILQFAGLALMVLAVVLRYVRRPACWLGLALAIAVVSPYLWGRVPQVPVLGQLCELLWGGGVTVAFPVFPWLFFPLCGMAFGRWLLDSEDRAGFLRKAGLAGVAVLAIGSTIVALDYDAQVGDYYRSGPGALLWMSGFILVWLLVCDVAVRRVRRNAGFRLMYFWSAKVTAFYFVQWVVIGWLTWFGPVLTTVWWTMLAIAGVLVVTDLLTRAWTLLPALRTRQPGWLDHM
jgi:hypothetical protein